MLSVETPAEVGQVRAFATQNRGLTPDECAELCLRKLIHVADTAAPALKEQARMFEEQLRPALIKWMVQAIRSDRTTLAAKLREAGHPQLADIIPNL